MPHVLWLLPDAPSCLTRWGFCRSFLVCLIMNMNATAKEAPDLSGVVETPFSELHVLVIDFDHRSAAYKDKR